MMECERTDCLFNIDGKCTRQSKENMTALEKWKNDFKEFISELSIPRDDYKGIMAYIDEVPNEASEQQPCKDWHDVPSDEMTLEQARQAVKDLRKKLAEDLEKNPCGDAISRQAAVDTILNSKSSFKNDFACGFFIDKIRDLPPVTPQPCEDAISRQAVKRKLQEHHDFFIHAYGGFSNMPQNDKSRVDEINNCIAMVVNEPPIMPKEKT